jgi:hypothetical protein
MHPARAEKRQQHLATTRSLGSVTPRASRPAKGASPGWNALRPCEGDPGEPGGWGPFGRCRGRQDDRKGKRIFNPLAVFLTAAYPTVIVHFPLRRVSNKLHPTTQMEKNRWRS